MEMFDGFPIKSGFSGPDWALEDCAAKAQEMPQTFEVPLPDEQALVKIGSLLRLHFLLTNPDVMADPESPRAERMWVEVCGSIHAEVLRGHLTNKPVYIRSLTPGDVIEFKWKHVAQVFVTIDDPRHRDEDT